MIKAFCVLLALGGLTIMPAQSRYLAGVTGGIATLSADARSEITATDSAASLYKPENGPTIQVVGGRQLTDYLSVQANYIWNTNAVSMTALHSANGNTSGYQQDRESTQHSAFGDLLIYFRNRASRIRPYLAIGIGVDRFSSTEKALEFASFPPPPPPAKFISTALSIRFPVGIDIALRHGWAARYSFTETIRENPISAHLSPPGQRRLAIFQNLFGVVKYL